MQYITFRMYLEMQCINSNIFQEENTPQLDQVKIPLHSKYVYYQISIPST